MACATGRAVTNLVYTANPAATCQIIQAFSETIAEPSDHLEEHCLNDSDARTMVDSANR